MIYTYDGTKEKCPKPLVKMRLMLKTMRSEDQCLLLLKDLGSINDIPALLTKLGHSFVLRKKEHDIVEICITNKKGNR